MSATTGSIKRDNAILQVFENGYSVIPIAPNDKRPIVNDWVNVEVSRTSIKRWTLQHPDCGWGIRCGDGVYGIDCDIQDSTLSSRISVVLQSIIGEEGYCYRIGESPKFLVPVAIEQSLRKMITQKYYNKDGVSCKIELLGKGQQFVAYGIHPDTGKKFHWYSGSPQTIRADWLPELTLADIEKLFAQFDKAALKSGFSLKKPTVDKNSAVPTSNAGAIRETVKPRKDKKLSYAKKLLFSLPELYSDDRDLWIRMGMSLQHEFGDKAFTLWDKWSQSSGKYNEKDCVRVWESMHGDGSITLGTLEHAALTESVARSKKVKKRKDSSERKFLPPLKTRIGFSTGAVRGMLRLSKKDKSGKRTLLRAVDNLELILLHWEKVLELWYDTGRYVPMYGDEPFDEAACVMLMIAIAHEFGLEWTSRLIGEVGRLCASRRERDPVVEYLRGLEWDGKKRLDRWLVDYAGAPDCQYTREVSRKHTVAAVARRSPLGAKWDHMVVLSGPQGCGKSLLVASLCPVPGYFSDTPLELNKPREAAQKLQRFWIFEMGELESARRADVETLKRFLSAVEDTSRKLYQNENKTVQRKCVFFGSTNEHEYLTDLTGNRRFLSIDVKPVLKGGYLDSDGLAANADQIWAEAVQAWRYGEDLGLSVKSRKHAAILQDTHMEREAWQDEIDEFIAEELEKGITSFRTVELIKLAISPSTLPKAKTISRDIGTYLRMKNKMTRKKIRFGNYKCWAYSTV